MTMAGVYLDNNASTRPAPAAVQALCACLAESYANPSSKHALGDAARQRLSAARAQVARLLNAAPAEIVFTSGGTEANHTAVLGALALRPGRNRIVTSAVEHPAQLLLFRHLESHGVRVSYLPVSASGELDLERLAHSVDADTALVSLMWANNETGVRFPIEAAARIAQAHSALFHTDAVQAAGKHPIDLTQVPVDFLSLSGHKLHGPPGTGALFVRKPLKLPALLFGHQERQRRGGTENLPGCVGLGVACALAHAELAHGLGAMTALRDRLEQGVLARVPFARVVGARAPRLPNTSNICFGTLPAEALLHKLESVAVYASSGAACTAGSQLPSHVLLEMGLTRDEALACIRFSLGRDTTAADIEYVLDVLPGIVQRVAQAANTVIASAAKQSLSL
ncbi:MAG: aminotransferase class V-fold PLP-dependent enzyme [Gammaproteobacteria bacterium]|nr:aminotransferase class V-fold PLP-dependent enzyme [Gammaproteobacteria bacterium]